MLKNEKGVTLVALIVTIVVLIIIAGATIATQDIISRAEQQQSYTEMTLIQTKVKILMEKASFSGDTETYYIGEKLKDLPNKESLAQDSLTSAELEQDTFYVYDQTVLDSIGLNSIKLDGRVYIVNYANGDVIIPSGIKNLKGITVYKLLDF